MLDCVAVINILIMVLDIKWEGGLDIEAVCKSSYLVI